MVAAVLGETEIFRTIILAKTWAKLEKMDEEKRKEESDESVGR